MRRFGLPARGGRRMTEPDPRAGRFGRAGDLPAGMQDGLSVLAVAFGLRLCWILYGPWVHGDSAQYLALARSIVRHGAFSFDGVTLTAYRPPLYPALIALLWHGHRPPLLTVYLVQAVLGAMTAVFVYLIARRAFGRKVALTAALLVAFGPMSGRYVATVMTETLFTFLLVGGVLAWGRGRWISAGVALGLATLTRAVLYPFVLLLVAAAAWPRWRRLPMVSCGGRAALVALLVVAPWVVRNYRLVGRPTVAEAGWTDNLVFGTIRLRVGERAWPQLLAPHRVEASTAGGHTAAWPTTAVGVLRYVVHHPGDWLLARLSQYPRLFIDTGGYMLRGSSNLSFAAAWRTGRIGPLLVQVGMAAGNVVFFVLAAWGLIRERRRLPAALPIWAFPAFLIVAQLPMYADARYGLPMTPLLAVFAASVLAAPRTPGTAHSGVPAPVGEAS